MSSRARFAAAALLLALPGCGYALVGKGVSRDASIKRVGVPLFKDSTGKPGLDQKITQKVVEEMLKRHFDVVQDTTGVDALVEGQITGYSVQPVGFGGGGTATTGQTQSQANRYAVTLTARIKYSKTGQTEPIWESEAFSFRDEYDVGEQAATFFDREDQAIERLSTSFARSLVAAMLEAF